MTAATRAQRTARMRQEARETAFLLCLALALCSAASIIGG